MPNTSIAIQSAAPKRRKQNEPSEQKPERAAWNIPNWCAALGLGRSTFYILAERPRTVKIGKRRLIVESPADYAARMAVMQAAA